MKMNLEKMYQRVDVEAKRLLSPLRYQHAVRTAEAAARLCGRFDADEKLGRLAGIAHDLGRGEKPSVVLETAKAVGRKVSPEEEEHPLLLHGWYGVRLLKAIFPDCPAAVCEAVEFHTAGKPGMGTIAKIIFCADYLEPGRDHLDRTLLEASERCETLDSLCIVVLERQLAYLRSQGRRIVKESLLLYDELKRGSCEAKNRKLK